MWGLIALVAAGAVMTDWTGITSDIRAHGIDPDRVILVPLAIAAVSSILLLRGARRGWPPPTRQLEALDGSLQTWLWLAWRGAAGICGVMVVVSGGVALVAFVHHDPAALAFSVRAVGWLLAGVGYTGLVERASRLMAATRW